MSDASTPAPVSSAPSNDNVMAAVATIPLVGLIIYFAMKDSSEFVRFYAKQSIGLLILEIVVWIVTAVIGVIPFLGWVIGPILGMVANLGILAIWLILLINALQGKKYRLPLLADALDQYIK